MIANSKPSSMRTSPSRTKWTQLRKRLTECWRRKMPKLTGSRRSPSHLIRQKNCHQSFCQQIIRPSRLKSKWSQPTVRMVAKLTSSTSVSAWSSIWPSLPRAMKKKLWRWRRCSSPCSRRLSRSCRASRRHARSEMQAWWATSTPQGKALWQRRSQSRSPREAWCPTQWRLSTRGHRSKPGRTHWILVWSLIEFL